MVKWSEYAKYDLKKIHDYIAEDSRYYAEKVSDAIIEKTIELEEFPQIGRVVPEINDKKIRELFIFSYRIIYECISDDVIIHAVIHGKRDLKTAFDKDKIVRQ